MASETTNLHLIKPGYNDAADIKDINDNMDILDNAHAEVLDAIDAKEDNLTKGTIIGTDSDVKDLDEYMTTGLYYVTVNAYLNNAPVEPTAYGWLEVLKMNTGSILQRFTQYGGEDSSFAANTYVRYYINSQWYVWNLVAGSTDNTVNMMWGGDDLTGLVDDSNPNPNVELFPYPMKLLSSTYGTNISPVGMDKKGIGWVNNVSGTEKYATFELCQVENHFPITVTFGIKAGSYYGNPVSAVILAPSTDYVVNNSGGTSNCGCVNVNISGTKATLRWKIGKAATMGGANYDGRYLYNMSDAHLWCCRVEYGMHNYDRYDLIAFMNRKEQAFEGHIVEEALVNISSVLTKGYTVSDFNNYTENGLYFVSATHSNSHAPVSNGTGYLEIWRTSEADSVNNQVVTVLQRFTLTGDEGTDMQGFTYARHYMNGVGWSEWHSLNGQLPRNMMWQGDWLVNLVPNDSQGYDPVYPMDVVSSTYSGNSRSVVMVNGGLEWNGANQSVADERGKYTKYRICEIDRDQLPVTVTFLFTTGGLNFTSHPISATLADGINGVRVYYKEDSASPRRQFGFLRCETFDDGNTWYLTWTIGRSEIPNDAYYDGYHFYDSNSASRVVAIRVEYGTRTYTTDEMKIMRSAKDRSVKEYVDTKVKGVYDNVNTVTEYLGLNTTNKTIVGAINEILARLQ